MLQRLTVLIDADIARFASAISSINGGLNGLARQAQQVGSVLSAAISAPIALLGKRAIDSFVEMDSLRRGLATLEKDAGSLTKRMGELNQVARLPGLGLREAYQFDVALRSAGFSADLSKRSMMAFGNALAIVGKGKNELKGVSVQLQQLAGKSGGFGADLRIIKEYAPQVGEAMKRAFGTSNSEAVGKLGLTGRQVIEGIVAELAKLPAATGGPKNAFENFGDTVTRTLDSIGSSIYKGLRLEGFFNGLAGGLEKLAEKFANLPATTQTLVASFGLLAVALPPLIAGIGFFTTTILPALRAGIAATKLAMAAFTGPIGLIALAVGVAAALIITHWDRIKAALVNTGVWTELKVIVKSALGAITSVFAVFANLFQGDWSAMWEHFTNILKYAWNGMIAIIGASILTMGGLVAKGLSIIGLSSWSKTVKKEMDAVKAGLNDVRFDIKAPAFNILDGLSFGGQNAKDGNAGVDAKTPKKKKAAKEKSEEVDSTLTVLERIRQHIEEQMQDIRASGEVVGEAIRHQLTAVENQIAKIKGEYKRLDYKPILDFKQADTKIQSDRIAKSLDYLKGRLSGFVSGGTLSYFSGQLEKLRGIVQNMSLSGLEIPKSVIDSIKEYVRQLGFLTTRANKGGVKFELDAAKADGGWSSLKGIMASWGDSANEAFLKNRDRLILSAKDMTSAVQNTLRSGAEAGAAAMGDFIGGLLTGTKGIADLAPTILNAIADMMQQLATALATSAAFLLLVNPAQAAGQFIAAAGLYGVAAATRSAAKPKAMANGGYATGATYSLTGEYAGANLHRNGEFVAPVRKGARLLVEEMAAQGGMGGGGGNIIMHRIQGPDLLLWIDRAQRGQKTYGGGR